MGDFDVVSEVIAYFEFGPLHGLAIGVPKVQLHFPGSSFGLEVDAADWNLEHVIKSHHSIQLDICVGQRKGEIHIRSCGAG